MTVFAPFGTATDPYYSVKLSYYTNIMVSEDGTEQRVMLRIIPKREESFLARTLDAYRTGWSDSLTYGNQNTALAIPEWPHGTYLTAAVTAGSAKTLNVLSTADRDFVAGGTAILWTDEGHTEEVDITSVASTSIVVPTLVNNWGQGTFVLPSHTGNYTGDVTTQRLSAQIVDVPVNFAIEHGVDPEVTSPTTANIFTTVPYMRVDVEHQITRMVERLESPTYTYADYELGPSPIGRRPFKVWLASRASVTSLIAWFHGVRGRFKTFYLPTYQQDLQVISGLGTTTVVIKRCGYTDRMFPMASRKVLAAVEPNGTVTKCVVEDAVDNGVAAGTETLTLAVAAPTNTTLLCYLLYGRLESDTLEIKWRHSGFADCEMGFVECPADLAPTEFEFIPDANQGGTPNAPAGAVLASASTAVIPNEQDEVTTFGTVTARDANGIRRTTGGDVVAASITGANTYSATVTDLNNGQYRLAATPHNTGTNFWAVTLGGSPVRNSPFTTTVGTTPVNPPVAMPFGFWASESFEDSLDYLSNITSVHKGMTAGQVNEFFGIAFAHGAKMVFAHPRALLKDSAGRFTVSRFQSATDNLAAAANFDVYRSNGTAAMLQIIDDVGATHWGGVQPTISQINQCIQYAKNVWPDIPVMVRKTPTSLLGLVDLDYGVCLYRQDFGDVTAYLARNERAADDIGCDIMMGLHVVNGGDGSSGVPGTGERAGWYAMSAAEITRYGKILMASSKAKWFNSFRFHDNTPHLVTYFATTSIRNALADLADAAASETR